MTTGSAPRSAPAAAVEVRRSDRRRRTVSAYRDGDRTVVLIPARFSKSDEERWVAAMVAKLEARERRAGQHAGDGELAARARALSDEHLDGRAVPTSVRWVAAMRSRWGSCTPATGAIRVSEALRPMPGWVLDYVLVHELAHLLRAGHDDRFWSLVGRFPRAERARGYLEGVSAAARLGISGDDVDEPAGRPDQDARPGGERRRGGDLGRGRPGRRRGDGPAAHGPRGVQEDLDSLLDGRGGDRR